MEMEIRRYKVCRECGADYTMGSSASVLHTKSTGHRSWKTMTEKRPKRETRVAYNVADPALLRSVSVQTDAIVAERLAALSVEVEK